MRTYSLLPLLALLAGCGPAFYQGRTVDTSDTGTEADVDTDTDGDTDADSDSNTDSDADTDVTDPCDGHDLCIEFGTPGGVEVEHVYFHAQMVDDDDDDFDDMMAGTVNWPDWTVNLTYRNITETSVGLTVGYIAAVRYNVSYCDGDEDGDDGDADHCTWLAYGHTSSEAYFTADSEVTYLDEDYDPETMTWCYDTEDDTDSNDDECGTSAIAGPSVDDD